MLSCCWCSDFSSSCLLLFILRNFDKMLSYFELYKVPSLILSQQVAIIIFLLTSPFGFLSSHLEVVECIFGHHLTPQ